MGSTIHEEKLKRTYQLWVEYLKLSKKYKEAYIFFEEVFHKNPTWKLYYSDREAFKDPSQDKYYYSTLMTLEMHLTWLKSLPDDRSEMFTNLIGSYILFGDLNEPFEKVWNRICFRYPHIIKTKAVTLLESEIDTILSQVGMMIDDDLRSIIFSKERIDEAPVKIVSLFRNGLKEYLSCPSSKIYAVINIKREKPNKDNINTQDIKDALQSLLQDYRDKGWVKEDVIHGGGLDYCYPTDITHNAALEIYLDAYLYSKGPDDEDKLDELEGKILAWHNKEDGVFQKKVKENRGYIELRDYCWYASQIISNAEKGIFPGEYKKRDWADSVSWGVGRRRKSERFIL